jgi:hypothetical protein
VALLFLFFRQRLCGPLEPVGRRFVFKNKAATGRTKDLADLESCQISRQFSAMDVMRQLKLP